MKWLKRTLLILLLLGVLFFLFLIWYRATYSMNIAATREVNTANAARHLLIATQGSLFKEHLVDSVIKKISADTLYIRVIDVTTLGEINEKEWDAMVMIHTWEYSKPPQEASDFITNLSDKNKLIAVATSGDGRFKIENVDGIASASKLHEIPSLSDEITQRLITILKRN